MASKKRDGLYKRGRFWWNRDPVTGTPTSTKCTDLEAARRYRAARERLAADPAHAAAQTARLDDWCGRIIAAKRSAKRAEPTLEIYATKLGHWLRVLGERFGRDVMLADINPGTVDGFVKRRRDEGAGEHTITKEFKALAAMLRLAQRAGCYSGNIEALRPPDLELGYTPRDRALAPDEVRALLLEVSPALGALCALIIALGCRLSEARKLRRADVDLELGRVRIHGTKTEEADRSVPILSIFRPLLEQALPYLGTLPTLNVYRSLAVACRRAGIEKCGPNDFRRTHATLLISAGVDGDVVRRLLGHTTRELVDTIYGRPTIEALSSLAEGKLTSSAGLLGTSLLQSPTREPVEVEETGRAPLDSNQRPTAPEAPAVRPLISLIECFSRELLRRRLLRAAQNRGRQLGSDTSLLHSPAAWGLALAAQSAGVLA